MKAVVAVVGCDTVGILAKVSAVCFDYNANILDVTYRDIESGCRALLEDILKKL